MNKFRSLVSFFFCKVKIKSQNLHNNLAPSQCLGGKKDLLITVYGLIQLTDVVFLGHDGF